MTTEEPKRRITLAFRWWWFRHRKHVKFMHPYGGGMHCAKCKIMAPEPYKENRS